MKMRYKLFFLCLLIEWTSCDIFYGNDLKIARKKLFRQQIGSYRIDIAKSDLGDYIEDSLKYSNLIITFRSDSTFFLNMQVPFIYDSVGKWITSNGKVEDWNRLYYKKNPKIGTSFTAPWTKDSIFYLNSTTPKQGEKPVERIYFKKIYKAL